MRGVRNPRWRSEPRKRKRAASLLETARLSTERLYPKRRAERLNTKRTVFKRLVRSPKSDKSRLSGASQAARTTHLGNSDAASNRKRGSLLLRALRRRALSAGSEAALGHLAAALPGSRALYARRGFRGHLALTLSQMDASFLEYI